MGTRAAAFTAKIRNLHDYHSRLTNGVMPLPTGLDISNTLKYFSQTLLVVLKDVPSFPLEMLKSRSEDAARMQLFPNLDYKSLFAVVVQLIDAAPVITFGIQTFGQHILQTIACLLPFLEHDQIDTLPYIVTASLGTFPTSLHREILDLLCYYLFPFTIFKTDENPEKAIYSTQSVSAVLMMVFQYTSGSEYHCQILEAVMRYKRDAIKDLLCVVAYGSLVARNVAINLLVYYWPHHNPTLYDRRNITFKFGYKVPTCKSEMCSVHNTGGLADATKVCYDHSIGISLAPENPPPLFLCQECASRLQSEQANAIEHLYDVNLPISRTGTTCDNKNCRSQGPEKIMNGVICFNSECASYNGSRPIRYCQQCHSIRHNNRRGADHVFHLAVQSPSYADTELLTYHVEAIVSLLLEAEPLATRGGAKEDHNTRLRLFTDGEFTDPIPVEERRLMGRFGIWLLVGFFNAEEEISKDILCRLLSSLFQWFNTTAYLGDDPSAGALERLKTDVVCPWLKKIIKHNFDTFVTCLLPHPPDFARVGGHWDVISSRTFHLREGFNRLFCLVPYEVISPEIWSQIMPNWMESMASEVPEEEMAELKIILSKVMDPEMNPLGFDARQMYQFIAVRFHQTSHKVKEQALRWLQVLSKLEIVIPLYFIFSIFREGIRPKSEKVPKRGSVSTQSRDNENASKDVIAAICQDESPNASSLSDDEDNFTLHTEKQTESELMLSSFIFMLDIILKQLELQEVEQHKGLQSLVAKDAMTLLHNMVAMPWPGTHTCQDGQECQYCGFCVFWYQLALEIVEKLAPKASAIPPDAMMSPDGEFGSKSFPEVPQKLEVKPEMKPSISPKSESMGLEGIIVNMPQILTATVETCSDMDLAPIMPSEKVVKAVARAVTITESETASATAHIASSATLVGDEQVIGGDLSGESDKDFWITSVGKFKFCIEELPPYLQFTFELLKKIPEIEDPELMEYLLKCLKIMFLHEEVMQKAAKEHRGFVIWCQENLLIKNLWELMDAEFSQLCEHAVPILVHCITLPVGADTFWKQIEEDFQSTDWRHRFTAVERVVTITRFIDSYPVKSSQALQTAMANAFCYTISSLDDPHVSVAQRAALYLGTINDSALQSLMYCLESQFDSVIIDRPVILQSLYLLINSVSDRKILRWDFFLNCFDTLFIEAQITLERMGDVSYSKDARHIDSSFDHFIKKLGRVQDSLSKGESNHGHKTLYSSIGTKWPYKRTMSAPAGFQKNEKDRQYCRQSSAPALKRKGSRHGVEGHIHGLLAGEDSHLAGIFHRIVEVEESDKETIHLLVFLFMQFLSRYNRGPIPSENKSLARTQTAVLRHVTMLLGYNPQEKAFFLTPSRVRSSAIFNSWISNLPQVVDQNFRVGATMLPISLTVLHYCPAPNKSAGSRMHPSFSLWFLEPHVRRHWLISLIVILYKYEYGVLPLSSQVQTVIRIVLNTLNYQEHRCRPLPSTLILDEPNARSREVSRGNLANADLEHITEHETPPTTPHSTQNVSPSFSLKKEHRKSVGSITSTKFVKKPTTSTTAPTPGVTDSFEIMSSQDDGDEIEPELAAIPESPKSHGSGEMKSFHDLVVIDSSAAQIVQSSVHQDKEFQTVDQLQSFQQVTVHGDSPKLVDPGPLSASSDKSKSWFHGDGGDSKSSSSGASTSSKSGGGGGVASALVKADFPWHLSVQAAFQIAKIPAPPLERLLPIGAFNLPPLSPTVKMTGRVSEYDNSYESQESSMALGNMISLGPQVRVDESAMDRNPGRDQYDDKNYKMEEYSKALHQSDSFGRSMSPKKLVKQPHVSETVDGSNNATFKGDANGGSKQIHDASKSVGFVPRLESGHARMHNLRQSSLRIGDETVQDRCGECGVVLETYTNEELGLCLVALETFIHREPGLAAPLMPEILKIVTRIALRPLFAWQAETSAATPGGVSSVAHQFLRCVLHQLAPYGVFVQLFQTKFPADRVKLDVFKSITVSLTDFTELNPVAPLQMLLEALNARKSLIMDTVAHVIENMAVYLECLPLEAASVTWTSVIPLFEAFLRKILPLIQGGTGVVGILRTMACLLRLPGIAAFKSILDPFSRILSFALGNVGLRHHVLTDLCHLCHRGFLREREKMFLTRVSVIELVQAMKFKSNIPDCNFLMLVTFILQDAGGSLAPYVEGYTKLQGSGDPVSLPATGAAECMRQHLTDSLEFLADFHSLSKIKSNYKGIGCGLNDDTLGGVIKGGISQFIALEISRGNSRENRAIGRHLPWLYNAPSAIQQGPKEFLDCVAHIRVLSWLLLGSLTHTSMFGQNTTVTCVPIPLEASCHVADHVHVIMTGFAEQSKASVLHMSALFHAFILCQVWTIYLEQVGPSAQLSSSNDPANVASNILTDFWGKVTPAILQLISHSKVLAEMVNLHFLSLLESLLECNSSVFNRLLPLWSPVLFAHSSQLPSHVNVRLQACMGYPPPNTGRKDGGGVGGGGHTSHEIEFPSPHCGPVHNLLLLKWVQRLQFKMAQIELQSSAATQFYPL
ncbi:Protein unc-79 [Folsomia candida]|uniref:Protein unc-79 n=1 Tax=Folsomia candida TaxID=158441 RepID=A0A226ES81_FOLCA|nr:Protein unc-79 [Folsomia candida]